MGKKLNSVVSVIVVLFCSFASGSAQLTGLIKTGFNIGTINQEYWYIEDDSIKYDKPLFRPILGIGAQYLLKNKWIFRQEIMFQIKGQGTAVPVVRSAFRFYDQDILRFISFPFTIHRKIVPNLYVGVGIQPSLYLSGTDNYYAKEYWHGWIYSGNLNVQYFIKDVFELGFEYDYDFMEYYCPGCGIRFYTYRVYGVYHFLEK